MNTIEDFIDSFESMTEKGGNAPTDESIDQLAQGIADEKTLREGLPAIKEKLDDFNACADRCSDSIKELQDTKRFWETRCGLLTKTLGLALDKLCVKSITSTNGVKLGSSVRTVLEVDTDWLTSQYGNLAAVLQNQLPEYIRVSLSVDKNKLSAYLKGDSTLLTNNPEKIHTKTSKSVTLR